MTAKNVASLSGFSEDEVIARLGFRQKKISKNNEHPSKFSLSAAKKVLAKSKFKVEKLDFIIYCSNGIYDYQFWSPSAYIQSKIKARKAITFEINNGCNSATLGLYLAKNLLSTTTFKYGLLLVCDTLSKFINYKNRNLFPLFSMADGAAAVIIGKNHKLNVILGQALYSDGNFSECNKIFMGGTKKLEDINKSQDNYIYVDYYGKKTALLRNSALVHNYVKVILRALKLSGIKKNDISKFLINQNSINILEKIAKKLNVYKQKIYNIREYYGHIGAVDTLFALEKCINKKIVKKNDYVLLASAGIGYHWGAQVIKI
jgi:3-oxoacyl-[acyl-carrier-protein] synthase-3